MTIGSVYLVGAGPGDPDLISVKGLRLIQQADVILYDRLIPHALLSEARVGAELINAGKAPTTRLPAKNQGTSLCNAQFGASQ